VCVRACVRVWSKARSALSASYVLLLASGAWLRYRPQHTTQRQSPLYDTTQYIIIVHPKLTGRQNFESTEWNSNRIRSSATAERPRDSLC